MADTVNVQVKSKGTRISPDLHSKIVGKMERLSKYLDRLQTVDLEVSRDNAREADQQSHVEATAHVPGRTMRVSASGPDILTAVDTAAEKLYRQLNRKKERMKSHHGTKPQIVEPVEGLEPVEELEAPDQGLAVERIHPEAMFEEEAALLLADSPRPFVLFLNARTELLNVLYERPDGSFALIEPVLR